MVKNFNYRELLSSQKFSSLLYQAYLYSFVECVKPSVVLTYIDNDLSFQWLSRNYPDADFYAIQNGVRNKFDLYDSLVRSDRTIKKMSMTHFVCFGQNDVLNYKRYGHQIDHYYCKGSLKGSFFLSCIQTPIQKSHYDICFVSQYRHDIFKETSFPAFKEATIVFFSLLKKYLEQHHPSTCIALSTSSEEEKEFYSEIFGNLVTIIPQNAKDRFSTYHAMYYSEVVVTLSSTAALEAFGWGKKVLFCNYIEDYEIADFYKGGLCSITQKDYNSFEKSLGRLRSIGNTEYDEMTRETRKFMMAYDPDEPVHEFLRKKITDSLTSKRENKHS